MGDEHRAGLPVQPTTLSRSSTAVAPTVPYFEMLLLDRSRSGRHLVTYHGVSGVDAEWILIRRNMLSGPAL